MRPPTSWSCSSLTIQRIGSGHASPDHFKPKIGTALKNVKCPNNLGGGRFGLRLNHHPEAISSNRSKGECWGTDCACDACKKSPSAGCPVGCFDRPVSGHTGRQRFSYQASFPELSLGFAAFNPSCQPSWKDQETLVKIITGITRSVLRSYSAKPGCCAAIFANSAVRSGSGATSARA